MNNRITYQQIVTALDHNRLPYLTLTLQHNVSLIVTQRGGRILGPFLSPTAASIFWTNKACATPASLADFLESGDWNLGGERIWIAPEIQYLVRDRSDFWGSIRVPAQMDPGQYHLDQPKPNQARLTQRITLEANNLASGDKTLQVEKLVAQVEDPLRYLSSYEALLDDVTFAGYEQVVTLTETKADDIVSESWNLVQLNPGGQLLIPASPQVEYSDYFEPIDEDYQMIEANHVRVNITGDRRFKVGYKAAQVFGRLAYFNQLDEGRAYLLVRNFFNNSASIYAEEPAGQPGNRGHSIHLYNDDGGLGGFGELEVNGQTIGGDTGRSSSSDQFVLWLYVGPAEKVRQLVPHLLGISPENVSVIGSSA
jgi:hypothetical protein